MVETSSLVRSFEFTLIVDGAERLSSGVEDVLFAAGCDDATISFRFGRLFLVFSRTANSLREAVLSAIRAVNGTRCGLRVLRVDECGLVTQSDISRKMSRSRQLVHQYMTGVRGPGGFPPPAYHMTNSAALWYWSEVALWLWTNNLIERDEYENAHEIALVNRVLEFEHQRQTEPDVTRQIMESVCIVNT
jgi:hypothetical protein